MACLTEEGHHTSADFVTSKLKEKELDVSLRYHVLNQQTGQIEVKEREATVDTPPGIDNGMNLRLSD